MPPPRWLRRTTVRIDGGFSELPPPEWRPGVESRHAELLVALDSSGEETWAVASLRSVLERVRDGQVIESIAVIDAWTENDDTFCLVYTPPWGPDPLVGVRRVRGDLDPVVHLKNAWHKDELRSFEMPDDAAEYAERVVDDISEPLGATTLHRATNGFAWWGTLHDWQSLAWGT